LWERTAAFYTGSIVMKVQQARSAEVRVVRLMPAALIIPRA